MRNGHRAGEHVRGLDGRGQLRLNDLAILGEVFGVVHVGHHESLRGPGSVCGLAFVGGYFAGDQLRFGRGAHGETPGGNGGHTTVVEVGEPIVGGRHQHAGGHDFRRHKVQMAEAEEIARVERCASVEQHILRRGVPGFNCSLQKVADGVWAVFPECELVVEIVDEHESGRLALLLMRLQQGRESVREGVGRDHDDLAARLRAVPMRGMIVPQSRR